MTNKQKLNRRLSIAVSEAKDADRIWRLAMAAHARDGQGETSAVRRHLDALWQERERAHIRVVELRWLAHRKLDRNPESLSARFHAARRTLAVMGNHATRRAF